MSFHHSERLSNKLRRLINEEEIECPNCGEFIVVVIDKSIDIQEYIEDCLFAVDP